MPYVTAAEKPKTTRDFIFEIGDRVRLRGNPDCVGVVVARSLSSKVGVLWKDRGLEQVDTALLLPDDWPDE